MKKRLFWLVPAAAALALAFLLPRLILAVRQNQTRHRVETLAVEDDYSENGNISTVEKMQLLCGENVQFLSIDMSCDESSVQQTFDAQLDRLIELGALSGTIPIPEDALSRTIYQITPFLLIDVDTGRLFRCYELETDSLTAWMDMDTGLLYHLRFWRNEDTEKAMEQAYLIMQMQDSERDTSRIAQEMSAWAAYYELQMSELIYDSEEHPDTDGNWNLVSCLLTDESGVQVGFALSNQYAPYTIAWRCVRAEIVTALRDAANVAEDDRNGN